MPENIEERPWEILSEITARADLNELQQFLEEQSPSDIARAISRLGADEQNSLLTLLSPEDAAGIIEEIPSAQAVSLIEQLPADEAATIVKELQSDEQADLLGELDEQDAEAILAEMAPADAEDLRLLSSFDADVAGGLMITEYLAFEESLSIADVKEDLSLGREKYADFDIQYVYVVSSSGRLKGVLRLRDLLLSRTTMKLSHIMIKSPVFVTADTSVEKLWQVFERNPFFGIPVTDRRKRLLGVLRRSAVADAMAGRADSDYLKSQGIVGGEELRGMPLFTRARRRLSWLTANIGLNIIAASVITLYQDTLASAIALAVFLPIVSDMSGCSGNQAAAVSLRELSLGILKPFEILHVWLKEVSVGLINGTVLGSVLGLAAWAWKGNPYLGVVVGAALALNTMIAVSIGGIIPLLLKKADKDPALASGPILTTVTDMCGFFLVLSLASFFLPLLNG